MAILGGGAVAWSSKKQQTITLSTTEAKYMALDKSAKQFIWLQHFIQELSIDQSQLMSLCSDNLSTITLSHAYQAYQCHLSFYP